MPKNTPLRIIDEKRLGGAAFVGGGSGGGGGVTDHGLLSGLTDDDHLQYHTDERGDLRYVPLTRTVTAGNGLAGGGALGANISLALASSAAGAALSYSSGVLAVVPGEGLEIETDAIGLASSVAGNGLNYAAGVLSVGAGTLVTVGSATVGLSVGTAQYQVPVTGGSPFTPAYTALSTFAGNGMSFTGGQYVIGQGAGLTVGATTVALTTPGTLAVGSANASAGNHTHAITSSADPDNSAAILATTGAGLLTLRNGAFRQAAQSQATFATGFAGSGWRVDYGVTTASKSSAEVDDLTVRGKMRVYELLIQQVRATNGSLFVSSASKVVGVTTNANPTWTVNGVQLTFNGSNATLSATIYTISTAESGDTDGGSNDRRLYHGFLTGDLIRAQQVNWNGTGYDVALQSNLEVTGVSDLFTYQATRVSGAAAAVGYDYVRLGSSSDASRRGAVYLTSDDSAAPFIDIVDGVQTFADWNSASVDRVRVGKLSGVSDAAFGGALAGYGLYGNNVYLKGQMVITGGSLGGLAAADVNANTTTIDGGKITANSVTANQIAANTITTSLLNFTPVLTGNVVASINATAEGLKISAALIQIDGTTTFSAGYDPTTKIVAGGAAADVNANVTTISGGKITTGSITALQIAASTITADKLSVTSLSAISANLGSVTAGQIVVGSTNKLWLNDSADGSLAIGGTVKASAPFQVSAAGYLTAEDATIGDLSVLDGNTFIVTPTAYSLTTKGYKFQSSGGVLIGGLTAFLPLGVGGLYLDNNFSSDTGSTPVQSRNATTAVRALGATGYVSVVDLYARHQATGLDSGLHIVNDPAQAIGYQRQVQLMADVGYLNGNVLWHAGNDGTGSGLDADKLDGQEGLYYTPKTNPTFPESIRFSSLAAGGSSPPSAGAVSIYLTAEKRLVIAYFDGTNTRYRWFNLNSADTGWNYQLNGTVPA